MSRDNEHDQNPNKPADVIRDSNLKATLWRNESDKGPYFATEFARTYTDDEGKPRDTSSFIGTDLLRVSELARKAYDRSAELRREEFKNRRRDEDRAPGRTRSERTR
ncbi:MAG: hypothetical protein RIB45_06030 [Marivibrio sp.]|uniref:hypothetical protein n=1 Tax=Marivibrio sp. TaxID=2039719 RepID=UPI0032EB26C3